MLDGAPDEQVPRERAEPPRSRTAKWEPVSQTPTGPVRADAGIDSPRQGWEKVLDAAIDAILLTDGQFRITWANRASSRVLGLPLEEIVGKTCSQALRGTDQPPQDCPLVQAHYGKSPAQGEVHVRPRDVWLEISAAPVLDEKGNVTAVLHIARDITDNKKMKAAMRESEDKYRDLFENAREAILLIDRNGMITRVNRLVEEYGFQREGLIGKRLFDFVVDDHKARAIADFEILLGGRSVKGEMDVVTPKGVFSVEYRDNPITRGNQIVGAQAILTDVTDRKRAARRLREERDKAQQYLDIAGVMLVVIDSEQRVGLINTRGCAVLGYEEEEILGKNWFNHFVPDSVREEVRTAFQGILQGESGSFERYSNPVLTRRGEQRLIAWSNTALRNSRGEIVAILSSGEDITERRRAEEAYRSLVDHSLQGLIIFQDGKAVFTNQAMAEITGYTIDEMRAMSSEQVRDFVHPEDRQVVWQNHRRRLAGEPVPEHYELRGIRKDHTVRWLDIHASRIDYRGKPAIQAAYIDITERKHAEEALRLSEERYRGIFENAVLGMYQTTLDGEILMANPALVRMLGYGTFEELAAQNLEQEGFGPEHPRSLFLGRVEADSQVVGLESAWTRRDGSTLWARESARAVRDETGKTLLYEGTVEDITDRKHAAQLTRTLATAAMELVELSPEADLFQYVGEKVLALIGAGIVSVNSIDGDTLTVRHITGAKTVAMKMARRLLGRTVIGMPFKGVHEVARNSLLTGKLTQVEGGLYELFFRTVPRPVCWTLEQAIGMKECYSIGLRRPNRLLGSVTILTQKGTGVNARVIEAFVNQASIALERGQAIEALLKAEERFRTLYESVQAGVLLQRADGAILHANQVACGIFGMTAESIQSKTSMDPAWQMILEDGTPVRGEDHPSMITLRTGEPIRGAVRGLFAGDPAHLRWLMINTEPLRRNGNGAVEHVMVTFHDITRLKQAEEELQRSEHRKTLLNRIANVFLTVPDEQMYAKVLAIVLETMESRFGIFGFMAENGDLVIPSMTREIWEECQVPDKSMVFPPATWGASLWGRALREQRVFCSNGPFYTPPGHIAIDSFLTVPILFGSKTIGLVSVANRAGGYTEADQDLLKGIADYFSPILNARLERDRQEHQRAEAERRLRESEAKYRELFENAREAIVIFNLDKIITDVNKFVATYGFRQEDLIGRNYIEFVAEPYREKAIEDFERLRQGIPLEGEFEVMTPKGQVTAYYKDSPIVRGGAVVGVQSILMDVTQHRRAEEALRKSEARYRLLANHASDIIWTTDLNLQLTYCSPSVERILGYTLEEALSRKADEDLTPASRELVQRTLAEEMEIERSGQGDPRRSRVVEVEEIRKDGTTLWAEIRASFLREPNSKAMGIVGVTRDVSERKKLEREIVARERYLNSFFTGATAGLVLLDKDLRYIQINDTLAEMNGVPARDHLGKTVREVVPHLAPMVEPLFRQVFTTGKSILNIEVTGQTPNHPGVQRHWMESFFPIAGADGNPEAVGAIVVEITERKRIERQLLDYQDRLRELATKLTLAEEQARRRIAVGVHEQIGQRLALAKLTLQSLLQSSPGDTDTSRALEGVCQDIDKVIEDAHSLTFELSNPILYEVGFEPAVESWLLQQVQGRYGIECAFEADENRVELDKETRIVLFDIVRELLTNVVKHAKAQHVDVQIRRIDDTVQTSVQDDGIGFLPSGIGMRVSEAGGFGLFNIREKLDYLGGSITIESALGEGTRVVVVVPLEYPRNSGKDR